MKILSRAALTQRHSQRVLFPGHWIAVLALLGLAWSCKTPQPTTTETQTETKTDAQTVEKEEQGRQKPAYPYRPSMTRAFDLLHTRLEVSFDWEKEQMRGEARLEMSPWFYPKDSVVLDAHGMLIHRVALFDGGELRDLPYSYDQVKLRVKLDRPYTRQETLQVFVSYTTRTTALDSLMPEGSPSGDQGLYFINPRGETEGKPRQIWTQGESHGSPAWFPTFDQPNERCTEEIFITVDRNFTTLSNGLLVNSTLNPDSTRTDYWRMTLPHAPYLFAMAIGEFAVVRDQWRGREVSYYVEPAFEKYARMIFGKTPDMLEFYSERLGLEYPWEKYSQVVVQDFVSGAMENTTATIHMGALQHDARQHLDNTYEDYVSHELFHQWFGDLVTCESWANLTLNEGFATYGEVLWREHAYGPDDAIRHHLGDRQSYLFEARRKQEPLIRYHHRDADDMFDGHSYQKGGQVIHMLRKVVGDEAFFESLRLYLSRNAYSDVEVHELRLAFEEVTGEDLNWFFDQWFLAPGHPVLEIERKVVGKNLLLRVKQVQDLERIPVFRFPLDCEFVAGENRKIETVWVESADTTFVIEQPESVECMVLDADNSLLATVKSDNNSLENWVMQLKRGRHYGQVSAAINALSTLPSTESSISATLLCLENEYFGTRAKAIQHLLSYSGPRLNEIAGKVSRLLEDPVPAVRKEAVDYFAARDEVLRDSMDAETLSGLVKGLEKCTGDSSYAVQASSLRALHQYDSTSGLAVARNYLENPPASLVATLAEILRKENDPGYLDFVAGQYRQQSSTGGRVGALRGLDGYIKEQTGANRSKALELLAEALTNDPDFYPRYFAARALIGDFLEEPGIRDVLARQAEVEPVSFLRDMMKKALK